MTRKLITIVVCLLLLTGCQTAKKQPGKRSMYYWSTTFKLSPSQQHFLKTQHISRLYVRFFDVVTEPDGTLMPNATISFASPFPEKVELIPTIFITNDCMKQPGNTDLAEKILRRTLQMCETHDLPHPKEIQIDCDWTLSTRKRYYAFLAQLQQLARAKNICLSTTIRLHQLTQPAPPADKGVLMVYNTGDITRFDEAKPILNADSVASYLSRRKPAYDLQLSAAYPIFSWKVLFRGTRYVGIMHSDDELPVIAGDTIVTRQPTIDDILRAKDIVERWKASANNEVILFDLSSNNITKHNKSDYEKIFSH